MDQQQFGALGFREVDGEGNPVPPELEGGEQGRSWPAPNPFIVALWLLATGLIAGGLNALLTGPMSVGMADRATVEYLVFAFAPQGVSGGITVMLALMFWHAWQWQCRRGFCANIPTATCATFSKHALLMGIDEPPQAVRGGVANVGGSVKEAQGRT